MTSNSSIIVGVAVIVLVAVGCSAGDGASPESRAFEIAGTEYLFPQDHIRNFGPPDEGWFYVRLTPPGEAFHLVLSNKTYREGYYGRDVPTVAHISDGVGAKLDVIDTSAGKVLCRRDDLHFNCGMRITDGRQLWSILFDRAQVANAPEIRMKAETLVAGYRVP